MEDITDVNQRLELAKDNKPSWVLEIIGLDDIERAIVYNKYDALRKPPGEEWVTGITPLIDVHEGSVTDLHDVKKFFDMLVSLEYKPSSKNPPPDTTNFQPKEVREWEFSK